MLDAEDEDDEDDVTIASRDTSAKAGTSTGVTSRVNDGDNELDMVTRALNFDDDSDDDKENSPRAAVAT